ncbi:unnamed protein product [Lymnaea stagnalis]|uniref:Protein FAM177A1 n=1 Tax=Lymnaea stagnalis TaxID=6523 RepID=A0AAV2HD27_LYMST
MAAIQPKNTYSKEVGNVMTTLDVVPKKKTPKRILHFSDGILEEYSSDEEETVSTNNNQLNPKQLPWGPWLVHYASAAAHMSLSAADFCGEKLASLLGITTPKYQYAIEEYKRRERELEEDRIRDEKLSGESQGLSTVDVQGEGTKSAGSDGNTGSSGGPGMTPVKY